MSMSRRDFTGAAALGAAAVLLGAPPAGSQSSQMRFANGSGVNDSQFTFMSVGKHKKLGFYAIEELDFGIQNMSSASQALQALATGEADFASLSPMSYLPLIAKDPSLDLIAAYGWNRRNLTTVVVLPDSKPQKVADLKGLRIGIKNQGDTPYFALQMMLKELGIDHKTEVDWIAVGGGGPAGEALAKNRIDALAVFDTDVARIELLGFKLRQLPLPQSMERLFTGCYGVSRKALAANHKRFVGLFRGMAKSTIFANANPELAVRLHWDLYPETKPKGKSHAEAMNDALVVLRARLPKLFPADWQTDKRMGALNKAEWEAQIDFVSQIAPAVAALRQSPQSVFTEELLAEVNDFDRAAVVQLAKTIAL